MENYNKYYTSNHNLKGDDLLVEFEKRRLVILDLIDDINILKNRVHKKNNEIDVLKKKNNELENNCKQLQITANNWNELKEHLEKQIVDSKAGSSQSYYYNNIYKYMQEIESRK